MKKYLLLILAIPFLFSSCTDEEPSPESKIEGFYERIIQGTEEWGPDKFDFVSTIEFQNDGVFYFEEVVKNIGGDVVLGYRSYGSGAFSITEGVVTLNFVEYYDKQVADLNYLPKSELTSIIISDLYRDYSILEDYDVLRYKCKPTENCFNYVGLEYFRVE